MDLWQNLRILSIFSSLAIGFWFPLKLIGHTPPISVEIFLDVLVSAASIVNVLLRFKENGLTYKNISSWKSVGLWADIFCITPFALIEFVLTGASSSHFIFINLIVVRHVLKIKKFLDSFDGLQPIVYRLLPLVFTMPLLVHLIACGWIILGSGTAGPSEDKLTEYIKALYWTFTTLTTVGYGDISAKTNMQMLFTCAVEVTGVAVFGFVLSNVASLLARLDAAREHHMDNMDRVETFMKLHSVPQNLKTNIRSYYHYLWKARKGYLDGSLLEDLPTKIQAELILHINRSIIEKVNFLKGASTDLLEDLMMNLQPKIFVPNEKIFRIDEPGDGLYFIHSGQVDIVSRNGSLIARLGDGDFFGEAALLTEKPRGATVKSTTYCDLYVLHTKDFKRVIQSYPEFREHLIDIQNKRNAA